MDISHLKITFWKSLSFYFIYKHLYYFTLGIFEDHSKYVSFKNIFASNDNEDKVNLNQNTTLEKIIANEKEKDMTNKNHNIWTESK